jgi:beta-glucosidase
MLREILLPAFHVGAKAGIQSVMASMGIINGEPVTASQRYLQNLLTEMEFFGLIVSDYSAIQQLVGYGVAQDYREAIKLAIDAGIDMAMWPSDTDFHDLLTDLVLKNEIPESRIDVSVAKIMALKLSLGLFDQPYPDLNKYV